jgi:ABC-2 type transport system ATP-binding protein
VPVISTRHLARHYGRRRGIEDVNLTVDEGEIFGFLGPNGAGKTTTIRILLGLMRANRGSAQVFDLDCWSQSPTIKRRVGYLPGDLRLYPWFTGKNSLHVMAEVHGSPSVRTRGIQLLQRFQLDPNVPVRKMSRGMRQKLGIVLALSHDPRLVILDEPTSGLDPLMCLELYHCLREIARQGTTVFFSSHTLSEVELLCKRVAIVRAGRIVVDEKLADLRKRARREFMVRFSTEAAAEMPVPDFLVTDTQHDRQWSGTLVGTPSQLVSWAATQPLEDMSLSPPSLESLFRSYYQDAEEAVP